MKFLLALLCGSLVQGIVTHTSTTRNLRVSFLCFEIFQIPYGTFAHFRLVGSGTDDPNLDADITQVGYELAIKSLQHGSIHNQFDLYLFTDNKDYDCFVMGSQLWTDYNIKQSCDFVTRRPQSIKQGIFDYAESSPTFLSSTSKSQELFVVLDNSGWIGALQNNNITINQSSNGALDTYLQFDVVTYYKDNDRYNDVFYFFCVLGGALLLTLLIFIIMLKCLKSKFKKLLEEKSEFKQQLYLKKQSELREDITALRAKS